MLERVKYFHADVDRSCKLSHHITARHCYDSSVTCV